MAGGEVARQASKALLSRKEELSEAVAAALYEEWPELEARYGERGRGKCLQDIRHHIEHLAPAVELDAPPLFEEYVRWLLAMLEARGVPAEDVRRTLERMQSVLRARLGAEFAAAVEPALVAGLGPLDVQGLP